MFRLFLLFFFLSAPAYAAPLACPQMAPPEVTVTVDIAEPKFDFSLNRVALNQKFAGIPLPNPEIYHLEINSVMAGELGADHKTLLKERADPVTAQSCVGFDRVDVVLTVNPVIYMASEFRRQECQYKAFLEHELKHVEADRVILNDYAARIREGLLFAFSGNADVMIGPIPSSLVPDARTALRDRIQGSIENLLRMAGQGRIDRQKDIDTYYEYARLSHAC